MKNFSVKFLREFAVDVQADDLETAQVLARRVIAQFAEDTCKLLSIAAAGPVTVEPVKVKRRRAVR